jgi:hypothetical protein
MTSALMAIGPCWSCGQQFQFNPDKVPSIPVCVECSRPTALHEYNCSRNAEVVKRPLCAECMRRVNDNRRRNGLSAFPIIPGAYDAQLIE